MTRRTATLIGLTLSVVTGALACSAAPELPPDLEIAVDPATAPDAPPTTKGVPNNSPPLKQYDAAVLPSPVDVPDGDGGASSDASDAGDGAAAVDAGPLYTPQCNGYLASDREQESNDTLATANVFNRLACSGINSPSDVDFFVVDTQLGLYFTYDPGGDAQITVTSPSGQAASAVGAAFYNSAERGRYVIRVYSPAHKTQTYLLVRN
jgi:hypothetical protein